MVKVLETRQGELKDKLLALRDESDAGPSRNAREFKPPTKASQLRFQIYGPPKAKFDHGFPTKKEIVQMWIHLTNKKKEEENVTKLNNVSKEYILKEIRDTLIDHWKVQESPRVIDDKDTANRLKVYVQVKKLAENCEDLTNKTAYIKSPKFIREQKEGAEGIFDVPEVIPKKRNFAEVSGKNFSNVRSESA